MEGGKRSDPSYATACPVSCINVFSPLPSTLLGTYTVVEYRDVVVIAAQQRSVDTLYEIEMAIQ